VWNDAGERVLSPTGRDGVAVVDLARPEAPRLVATLPLENSVAGPPVNVAISPDNRLALVADSYTVVAKGAGLKIVPTNKLFVVDLAARRPRLAQTLEIGLQPSGLSINPAGTLALVGYRADNAVGVLKIERGRVREIARIPAW
jgi:DNA-binding beta-propeller fold protein YncE